MPMETLLGKPTTIPYYNALTANIISESIYAMCDLEGERVLLFDCIVDLKHEINDMTLTDQKFVDSRGKAHNYRSTKGWQIFYQWKYRSMSW